MTVLKLLTASYALSEFALMASADPVAVPYVLFGSLVGGGVGGWISSRIKGESSSEQLTTVVMMAGIGCMFSMVGYWRVRNDELIGWGLVPAAFFLGILGRDVLPKMKDLFAVLMENMAVNVGKTIEKMNEKNNEDKPRD